jgi:hypothetical protein
MLSVRINRPTFLIIGIISNNFIKRKVSHYFFLGHHLDKKTIHTIFGNPKTAVFTKAAAAALPALSWVGPEVFIDHKTKKFCGWVDGLTGKPLEDQMERYWNQRTLVTATLPIERFVAVVTETWSRGKE